MTRLSGRQPPERERVLRPACRLCPACGAPMRIRYKNHRTLVTLTGSVRLRLKIRWCETLNCPRFHKPYRPEAEGALALPADFADREQPFHAMVSAHFMGS